jgi:PEP-CTERM motif
MMKPKMTLAVAALLTIGLSSAAAYADTVIFTLTNPNAGVLQSTGGSVTYDATVSAPASNGAAVFLNGDAFNVTAPVTLNDSDFFADFPLSLAPGTSFTGDLFVLTIPAGEPFGTYLGTFTLLGGADGGASDVLGTVNFSFTTTPEPSSILLLMTGMAGLGWAGVKRNLRRGWAR